jgi:ubiquinone/menaquinone biosynthesis C-methylase UbiE
MELYKKFQAYLLNRWKERQDLPVFEEFKKDLFSNLSGTVVEIGPGAGTNFKYFSQNIHWIGIEPNVLANDNLQVEAQRRGLKDIEIINGFGERLPLADNSYDTVIATRVLCSVSDQVQVLAEIKRVLKPNGRYIFIEHTAAPRKSLLWYYQNLINPLNRLLAGNCHANREILSAIKSTGFKNILVNERKIKLLLMPWPYIWGSATKT